MSEKAQFLELTRKKYSDQAIWFLNGFWKEGAEQESENIWNYQNKFVELDSRKKEGNELDEFWSHKFLESLGETLTVIQLRERLRKIDLDANGKMALLEYLMFKYSKGIPEVLNAPQGDNTEEIEKAQAELQAVQDALASVQTKLEEQKRAKEEVERRLREQQKVAAELKRKEEEQKKKLAEQKQKLAEQKAAEEEARRAEEEVRRAEGELRAAVNELKAQEDNYHKQIEELTRKSESGDSIVAKNKAKQELAQLKQENPLPLRRAKITQEAALRKVEKQRKAAEAATQEVEAATREVQASVKQAEAAARELEHAKHEAEESTRRVEEAVRQIEAQFQQAQDYLEEVKKKDGVAYGAIWWMERELKEAKKYLPRSKQ